MNWHGKPLGAKSNGILESIAAKISNNGPHGLVPSEPSETLAPVKITNISLSEPPQYEVGQKVSRKTFGFKG